MHLGANVMRYKANDALAVGRDRIPVGEVRGAEALDLLKAWGTGHPGGIGTIHSTRPPMPAPLPKEPYRRQPAMRYLEEGEIADAYQSPADESL